jgi:hypothetical protein
VSFFSRCKIQTFRLIKYKKCSNSGHQKLTQNGDGLGGRKESVLEVNGPKLLQLRKKAVILKFVAVNTDRGILVLEKATYKDLNSFLNIFPMGQHII